VRRFSKSPNLLLRQGEILMGGALLLLLLVAGFLGAEWTPLLIGGIFALAAGASGGPDPYWAVAAVFGAWGALSLAGVLGSAGEIGFWTIGIGLLGAIHVLLALSPGGRGGT
jgi:hypothetical protein